MRRIRSSSSAQSLWGPLVGVNPIYSNFARVSRLLQYIGVGRVLAPKFFLNSVSFSTQNNRYYPTLVNGLTTRSLVILRLFDSASLLWAAAVVRLLVGAAILWFSAGALYGVSSGALMGADAFFGPAGLFETVVVIFVSFVTLLSLLSIAALVWSPVSQFLVLLFALLPLIYAVKSMAYGLIPMAAVVVAFNKVCDTWESNGALTKEDALYVARFMLLSVVALFVIVPLATTILFAMGAVWLTAALAVICAFFFAASRVWSCVASFWIAHNIHMSGVFLWDYATQRRALRALAAQSATALHLLWSAGLPVRTPRRAMLCLRTPGELATTVSVLDNQWQTACLGIKDVLALLYPRFWGYADPRQLSADCRLASEFGLLQQTNLPAATLRHFHGLYTLCRDLSVMHPAQRYSYQPLSSHANPRLSAAAMLLSTGGISLTTPQLTYSQWGALLGSGVARVGLQPTLRSDQASVRAVQHLFSSVASQLPAEGELRAAQGIGSWNYRRQQYHGLSQLTVLRGYTDFLTPHSAAGGLLTAATSVATRANTAGGLDLANYAGAGAYHGQPRQYAHAPFFGLDAEFGFLIGGVSQQRAEAHRLWHSGVTLGPVAATGLGA